MEKLNETLGGLIIIIGMILIVYIIAKYNYLIRKMMIEKGMNPKPLINKSRLIDWFCLLFFVGIGVMISSFFTSLNLKEDTTDLLIWGNIFLFGSFGPLSAHFLRKKMED
ncbi:MAG: hypothetical protein AAF696_36040 [Bacteroidota bacterium]